MKYNYLKVLGLAGALLSTPLTFAQTHTNNTPEISTTKGSFYVNLKQKTLALNSLAATEAPQLNQLFQLDKGFSFQRISSKSDNLNFTHTSFQQRYKGYPVEGYMVMFHAKNGKAISMNGRIANFRPINTQVNINAAEALVLAKQAAGVSQLITEDLPQLVIVSHPEGDGFVANLVYKVRINSAHPFKMVNVYVDAKTGKIDHEINLVQHAQTPGQGQTLYSGVQAINVTQQDSLFVLIDSTRNIHTYNAVTGYSIGYNGIIGASEFYSSTSDFSGLHTLDSIQLTSLPQTWLDTIVDSTAQHKLYIKILKDGSEIYSSAYEDADFPLTFKQLNLTLFHGDYSLEIWNHQSIGADDYAGSFTLNTATGSHQIDTLETAANYTIDSKPNPAIDVHWGMATTLDFYEETFNRDSYDDNGSIVKQYVGVTNAMLPGAGFPNNAAALRAPFNFMVYGLGDGELMNPIVALDVEGHEFTHMVIDNNGSGGLTYMGESGALNESFADIMGTCVEFFSDVNPDWQIGAGVLIGADQMRSMSNPSSWNNMTPQPDTYEGTYWIDPDSYYDNGGVHINSGVQNYWFYLLSEGGSGTNDNNDAYNVTGLGIEKAQKIAYRSLMNYLPTNASYLDAYHGSLQATADLYGNPSAEYSTVEQAWFAVGVGHNPNVNENCQGTLTLTEQTGTFNDGSNAENYPNNSSCSWLIQPENTVSINLTFTQFNTESDLDKVIVYDGADASAPVLGTFSGDSIPTEALISTTGSMYIEFFSNDSLTAPGWEAYYEGTLNVNEATMQQQLRVYPNPTNGVFTIESNLGEAVQFELYNVLGQRVRASQTLQNDTQVNVSDLESGVYFIQFHSGATTHTEKLIVK